MNILRIDASAKKQGSHSRALLDHLIDNLPKGSRVQTRDLTTPIAHVDDAWVTANTTPASERTEQERKALALSDTLVDELKAADVIVMGLPVYNFSVPASLKAWVDQVCRARLTFTYTDQGPKGLLEDKKAIIVFVSGGTPLGSDIDFASGYMRHILGFIGIDDVTFIEADGHMRNPEKLHQARDEIAKIARQISSVS